MLDVLLEVLADTLIDSVKLLPFLLVTYIVMEYLEHKTSDKTRDIIKKSGKFGPFAGSLLGAFPQCGFSAAASNLYAGRVITMGTLISIYLSTSDEMLPILISEQVSAGVIIKILAIKIVIGMIAGFVIDWVAIRSKVRKRNHEVNAEMDVEMEAEISHMCEHEHCHCEEGIFKSALKHTFVIMLYIVLISFALNAVISLVGEDALAKVILDAPVIGNLLAGLVGLIPNCAASVVITQLYLEGILSTGSMLAGLLAGSGVGLIVLFKVNDKIKENLKIVGLVYAIGVVTGVAFDLLGIVIR